ncbi:MAG: anthranilate synthase component I [Candidatus Brocadiales bacterium]|nr:anthranilate synthase component I [Candidatus Brocadiales bacterium]
MKSLYYPSYEEFKGLVNKGNLVPLYRQLLADTLTPVSALQKLSQAGHAFLLESAAGGEKMARYSFLGVEPFMEVKCMGHQMEITRGAQKERFKTEDPLDVLEREVKRFSPVAVHGLPRFSGGAVGYFGYDTVRYVETLPTQALDDLGLPDLFFMFFDSLVIFDHLNKTIKVVSSAWLDGQDTATAYKKATQRIDALIDRLRTPVLTLSDDITPEGKVEKGFSSNFDKERFLRAVERCKEYIKAGDVLQVVLSQRLGLNTKASPLDIYRALRVINPSPYMFYLEMGDVKLIGSSPEVMVKVEANKVTVRPIAGTRRRGSSEEEDRQLERDLLSDPKERAEHIMLVDLGRNDVGRVAEYGSVSIEDKMIIEKYSHVMHITSSVTGRLRGDKNAFDTLKACLPAGTLSGAPKIRAMEIIEELEPTRRGPYGGAVGYIDFSGSMDTCITIRTIILKDGQAYIQAGAGIVADSVPEKEYEETLNKAKGLLKAIEAAERMGG